MVSRRLRTDRLDCYLLHWRSEHPLEETISAIERLQSDGKSLSWGVSNFDASDLDEVWSLKSGNGPVCNQVLSQLRGRAIEHEVLPWCEKHQLAVVAYSPFGHGNFPELDSPGGRILKKIADDIPSVLSRKSV